MTVMLVTVKVTFMAAPRESGGLAASLQPVSPPTFAQVTQDCRLRSSPFTRPAAGAGRTDAVHPDVCMYAIKWTRFPRGCA